ncbi:MAG: hypothetical protein HKM04_06195 [Legionellales bacterium]|nr:hypothetical protein [Legionellales bacterium]
MGRLEKLNKEKLLTNFFCTAKKIQQGRDVKKEELDTLISQTSILVDYLEKKRKKAAFLLFQKHSLLVKEIDANLFLINNAQKIFQSHSARGAE